MTRSRLMDAIAQDPSSVLYLATDGIIATRRLDIAEGPSLGDWEIGEHPAGVFVVQPGLYWGDGERAVTQKRRGMPQKPFAAAIPLFERAWTGWMRQTNMMDLFAGGQGAPSLDLEPKPAVDIFVPNFIGVRLAMARGKPETAGRWTVDGIDPKRSVSFDWTAKRRYAGTSGSFIRTLPWTGSPNVISTPYLPLDGEGDSLKRALEAEHETLLDAMDFSPPRFEGGEGQA
jgi:hypothetical protein